MEFSTKVTVDAPPFLIQPCERMLFVGSCFADSIGKRFRQERFRAVVNPYGVMYNPASILHTVERYDGEPPRVVVVTLGTNHVYILKETGEIVDNCRKRPQKLFREESLGVDECADYLSRVVDILLSRRADTRVVMTVSPIRYAKYGFHGSALSKAVLLLAAQKVVDSYEGVVSYFPAYEIVNDELRDYRYYADDMLHPSDKAVEYIWERFSDVYFDARTKTFLEEWRPLKEAFAHRPFDAGSPEYQQFLSETRRRASALARKYPDMEWDDGQ